MPPAGGVANAAASSAGTVPPVAADWKKDAPGRVHRIDIKNLPAPFATASVRNVPRLVPKPEGAKLAVPPGFQVDVFAEGLTGPRSMLLAPNGDVIVAETKAGTLKVLRPAADGKTAAATVFATGLQQPYGLAFYPSAESPRWLYVAEVNRVVRYAFKEGITAALDVPEVVIPQLSPVAGGHYTRDIAFSPDGKQLYVAVGSLSNFAEKMAKKTVEEAGRWQAQEGLGAAWDNEENRAQVRVFAVHGGAADDRTAGTFADTRGRTYATGLRNCAGMTLQPGTGEVWCAVNERDALGDDLVPDYATRVHEGAFYGWPWYYLGNHEEPRLAGERPDLAGKTTNPDVLFTSHSAAVNIKFYTAPNGASRFPQSYRGCAVCGAARVLEPRRAHRAQGRHLTHARWETHRRVRRLPHGVHYRRRECLGSSGGYRGGQRRVAAARRRRRERHLPHFLREVARLRRVWANDWGCRSRHPGASRVRPVFCPTSTTARLASVAWPPARPHPPRRTRNRKAVLE